MELLHIISFICGGLVSAIIFYPNKKSYKSKINYLTGLLSFQFYLGVRFGQTNKRIPPIEDDVQLRLIAMHCAGHYAAQAEMCAKQMEEL